MITLDLTNSFTFNTLDGTEFKGTFRDLTIKEEEHFKDLAKEGVRKANKVNKLVKKMKRNEKRISCLDAENQFDEADKLEDANNEIAEVIRTTSEDYNPDKKTNDILRERFELCLVSEDKQKIIDIAEKIGYKPVFDIIKEAIAEGKLQG